MSLQLIASTRRITTLLLLCCNLTLSIISQPQSLYGAGTDGLLGVYQKYISPTRGTEMCPMFPSCSQYAAIKFANEAPLPAYLDVCDRLLRCGNDINTYKKININGINVRLDTAETFSITDTFGFYKAMYTDDIQLAAFELKRCIYFEPQPEIRLQLNFKLAKLYFNNGDYIRFSGIGNNMLQSNILPVAYRDTITYMQSFVLFKQQQYEKSKIVAQSVTTNNDNLRARLQYVIAANNLCLHKWAEASTAASQIPAGSPDFTKAQRFLSLENEYRQLPLKQPWIAAITSVVVPGSGYIYAGKTNTGIASLLLNTIFAWAAYDAYHQKQYGMFSATCFIGFGWYAGSIRGAYKAVKVFNGDKIDQFIRSKLVD